MLDGLCYETNAFFIMSTVVFLEAFLHVEDTKSLVFCCSLYIEHQRVSPVTRFHLSVVNVLTASPLNTCLLMPKHDMNRSKKMYVVYPVDESGWAVR